MELIPGVLFLRSLERKNFWVDHQMQQSFLQKSKWASGLESKQELQENK